MRALDGKPEIAVEAALGSDTPCARGGGHRLRDSRGDARIERAGNDPVHSQILSDDREDRLGGGEFHALGDAAGPASRSPNDVHDLSATGRKQ